MLYHCWQTLSELFQKQIQSIMRILKLWTLVFCVTVNLYIDFKKSIIKILSSTVTKLSFLLFFSLVTPLAHPSQLFCVKHTFDSIKWFYMSRLVCRTSGLARLVLHHNLLWPVVHAALGFVRVPFSVSSLPYRPYNVERCRTEPDTETDGLKW